MRPGNILDRVFTSTQLSRAMFINNKHTEDTVNVARFLVALGLLIFSIASGLVAPVRHSGTATWRPAIGHAVADGPYPPDPVSASTILG